LRVLRKIRVTHHRADAKAPVGGTLNRIHAEPADVDQMNRRFDLEFHQVKQIGAARNEFCAGSLR